MNLIHLCFLLLVLTQHNADGRRRNKRRHHPPAIPPSFEAVETITYPYKDPEGDSFYCLTCQGCVKDFSYGLYYRHSFNKYVYDPSCCPNGICNFPARVITSITDCEDLCLNDATCSIMSFSPLGCLLTINENQCQLAVYWQSYGDSTREKSFVESKKPLTITQSPASPYDPTAFPTIRPSLPPRARFRELRIRYPQIFKNMPYYDVTCNQVCTKDYSYGGYYMNSDGTRKVTEACFLEGGDGTFPKVHITSQSVCQLRCEENQGCTYYSFSKRLSVCLLFFNTQTCELSPWPGLDTRARFNIVQKIS